MSTNLAIDQPSDEVLAAHAARGERSAYETLVRRHYSACTRFAERMLRDRADAEDAVQDTFLRAFVAIERFDVQRSFRGWLFGILVKRCRTVALQRSRRARRFPLDEMAVAGTAAPDVRGAHERSEAIARAIGALDPLLREAFLLKYVEGMEYQEMADVLGASVSALKMRVKRACAALRPGLETIYADD